jgi:3-phenylpropionate/trans-cinnamate dioxygenase ferredoxin subunit
VCRLDEVEPGGLHGVEVDGVAVVVARTPNGEMRVLRDRCSHEGARLSRGRLLHKVGGDSVGSYVLSEDEFVVRCPWHGYEFDLETGHCIADPRRARVRAYHVTVEDGVVYIER